MRAVPRLDAPGLMTPAELLELEQTWSRFQVVGRLIAHIRVLHYRYQELKAKHEALEAKHESLKAWAQAVDPEAYASKFGAEEEIPALVSDDVPN